ncbi:uncharacterized protein LOC119340843 [Triticum dicoccoides]|uniref:uncharacterized protein LOC119340843 n=1 Tax=Triticum dicoccoides TaxID=85692 RepID=UPI00188F5422|nr:uncharacterized protein LOC119340843 [Triticum dicoccoides]
MVSRLDVKLSSIASMMSYAGILVHLKAMVKALPIFAMCNIRVAFTILDNFEKSGRCFLWCWKNINKHGKCLAKWEKARKLRLASRGTVNPTLPVRILHFVMTYATEMVTEVGPAEMVTVNASENCSKKVTKNKVWK